jgi:hypothetical protein
MNDMVVEEDALTIDETTARVLDDLYRRKITYRNMLMRDVYMLRTNCVTFTGSQNATRFTGEASAQPFHDDVLSQQSWNVL